MTNLFDLTGKVALVTGGSRGLGYQMVKAFAEHGADAGGKPGFYIGRIVANENRCVRIDRVLAQRLHVHGRPVPLV